MWGQRHERAVACFKEHAKGIFFPVKFPEKIFPEKFHVSGTQGVMGGKGGHSGKWQVDKLHPMGLAAAALLSEPLSQCWVPLLPKPTAKQNQHYSIYILLSKGYFRCRKDF